MTSKGESTPMARFLEQLSWKLADKTGLSDDMSYYVIIASAIAFAVSIVALAILADYLAQWWALPMSFEKARRKLPTAIFWGMQWLSEEIEKYHFAITGTTRSGKSLMLLLFLRSILSRIRPGSDRRLILFDPKNELHTCLTKFAQVPVYYLLPTDRRSCRWDLARDFRSPAAIKQFCQAVVPDSPGDSNPFFTRSFRELMVGIMTSLTIAQRGQWDLADVVRILESRDYTAEVLSRTPATWSRLRFMGNEKTWANIEATVETQLNDLRILAALWSRAQSTFSLIDFVQGEGILVLGRDPRAAALLDPVNMLLLTQLFSHLLAQGDSDTRRTYVVCDELTVAAGDDRPLPGFKDICERGAARGVVVAVAYQSYADVKALYKESADAILGMLQNQVFLRAGDAPTARYVSEAFGRGKAWGGADCAGSSLQSPNLPWPWSLTPPLQHEVEEVVPYEQVLGILPATPRRGIWGHRLSAEVRDPGRFHLPGSWIDANVPKKSEDVQGYLERPHFHQYLEPFSYRDLARLKLSIPARAAVAAAPPPAMLPAKETVALPPPPAQDELRGKLRRLIGRARSHNDASTA